MKKQFTLVELLTVIAVIAILVGMLIPAINRARGSAYQSACLNNLNQLSKAEAMFMADNMQKISSTQANNKDYNQVYCLFDYLGKKAEIFLCPVDSNESITKSWKTDEANVDLRMSYRANSGIHYELSSTLDYKKYVSQLLALSMVDSPSAVMSLAENAKSDDFYAEGVAKPSSGYATLATNTDAYEGIALTMHNKKRANYLYLDGHAENLDGVQEAPDILKGSSSAHTAWLKF